MSSTWVNFVLCIWAGFCPCNTIVQPPMVLRRDQMEATERIDKIVGLKPMVSCMQNIAHRWFNDSIGVSLLVPDFIENPGLSKLFSAGLEEVNSTIFSFSEDFSEFKGFAVSAVILVRNSTDFNQLNNLTDLCASNCSFVVCLLDFQKDKASLLAESDEAVKAMWKMGIAKVVIIVSTGGEFFVTGTYSFEPGVASVPGRPEILADCNELSTEKNTRIFHKLLMNNCQINVTVADCMPYVQLVEKEGSPVFSGIEGEMFEAVARSLNISLNRMNVSAEDNLTVYDILYSKLGQSAGSDVVFCELYWGEEPDVVYSVAYEMQKVVWLVPPRPALTLLGLVTPLKPLVWFAIIGLLLFAGLMKVLLFRKLSFLGVVGLILGIALPRQPNTLSNRIQFVSWVFFGYIITQSYLASLAGQLMNTNVQTIETIEQLVNSGITLAGNTRHMDLFKDDDRLVYIYNHYQNLSADEYEEVLGAMETGKNTSIALVTEIKVSAVKNHPGPYDPHILDETLAAYSISLAAWKKLPYMDQINERVQRLVESGLIKHWSQTYVNISSSMVEVDASGELDILHLSPSFLLLLIGHAIGIVTLFIEIGIHWRKKYLKKRNKVAKKFQ